MELFSLLCLHEEEAEMLLGWLFLSYVLIVCLLPHLLSKMRGSMAWVKVSPLSETGLWVMATALAVQPLSHFSEKLFSK